MKDASYRGVKVDLPKNVSISLFKRVVDECGKDHCITVQAVVDLLSNMIQNNYFNVNHKHNDKRRINETKI
jgi:hypothetical protein